MPFAYSCAHCPDVFDVRDGINEHITETHPDAASHEFTTQFVSQYDAQREGPPKPRNPAGMIPAR